MIGVLGATRYHALSILYYSLTVDVLVVEVDVEIIIISVVEVDVRAASEVLVVMSVLSTVVVIVDEIVGVVSDGSPTQKYNNQTSTLHTSTYYSVLVLSIFRQMQILSEVTSVQLI